jgi:acyl-CoA reductase-like NAD-dependent aldehyde dehydrogenase
MTRASELGYDRLFIGGQWCDPSTSAVIEVHSPHDGRLIGSVPEASQGDVVRAVAAARQAMDAGVWALTPPEERQAVIRRFDELHHTRSAEFAALITAENGSPIWFTSMLQDSLTNQTGAYLRAAGELGWEERRPFPGGSNDVVFRHEPVGVVAAVIPWNAPHQSALTKVVPALLAGNSVILKLAPETALDGMALGDLLREAGLPDDVFSVLPAGREVSEYLVSRSDVDKIAFTGSTAAGRKIGAIAGEQLKRVSLELGGKSASIVLPDADLDGTVAGIKYAAFSNNGEACIAHTRILLPRSRYAEFVDGLAEMTAGITVGDPSDPSTFVGPMVRADQRERVRGYIALGTAEGARLVVGGPDAPSDSGLQAGHYVRPTLFAEVDNGMRIAQEEIFGPVIAAIPYTDEDDAVRIANDSPYGLGGGVWTADRDTGLAVARRIRTGTFSVNGAPRGFEAPFGGYKASGIGREYGTAGLTEFTEHKSVAV